MRVWLLVVLLPVMCACRYGGAQSLYGRSENDMNFGELNIVLIDRDGERLQGIPFVVVGIRAPEPVQSVVQWWWLAVGALLLIMVATARVHPRTLRSAALLWDFWRSAAPPCSGRQLQDEAWCS